MISTVSRWLVPLIFFQVAQTSGLSAAELTSLPGTFGNRNGCAVARTQDAGQSDSYIYVDSKGYSAHEVYCSYSRIKTSGKNEWNVDAQCSSEGTEFVSSFIFRLASPTRLSIESLDDNFSFNFQNLDKCATGSQARAQPSRVAVTDNTNKQFKIFSHSQPTGESRYWTYGFSRNFGFGAGEDACFISTRSPSNSILIISKGNNGQYLFSIVNPNWQSLNSGQTYDVQYVFDRHVGSFNGSAIAIDSDAGPGLTIKTDKDFLRAFAASRNIKLRRGSREIDASGLSGSRKALSELERCAKARLKIDPFRE